MRSDYALYAVAIILFVLTGIAALAPLALAEFERNVWLVTTAVLGLLFAGLGYSQKPKKQAKTIKALPPVPPTLPVTQVTTAEKKEAIVEAAPTVRGLTEVRGIGEKRKEQLKSLGISSVEDLARASAKDLATRLEISPKITGRWIEDAKKLLEKS